MGPHSSFSASSDSIVFLVSAQDGNSVTEILRPSSILSSATSATWNHGPVSLSLPNFSSGQTGAWFSNMHKEINLFGQLILKAFVFDLQVSHNIVIMET